MNQSLWRNLNSVEDFKSHIELFFAKKDKKFWVYGIMKLPEKWQTIAEQNGRYFFPLN